MVVNLHITIQITKSNYLSVLTYVEANYTLSYPIILKLFGADSGRLEIIRECSTYTDATTKKAAVETQYPGKTTCYIRED